MRSSDTTRLITRPIAAALAIALGTTSIAAQAGNGVVVTSTGDAGDSGACTLRQAIAAIGGTSGAGACVVSTISGADTITFSTATFPFGAANEIVLSDLPDNSLTITDTDLRIDASANGNVAIRRPRPSTDATNAFGIIYDGSGGKLSLSHLTISNGHVKVKQANQYAHGGGVSCLCLTLAITDSTISGNTSDATKVNATQATIPFGYGGGIYEAYGMLTLEGSTVTGNTANAAGGGISIYMGGAVIDHSIITGNTAAYNDSQGNGGGVYVRAPNTTYVLEIDNTLIAGNTAMSRGGGVDSSALTQITSSSIVDNYSRVRGGGIHAYGQVLLTTSTLARNTSEQGAGIDVDAGSLNMTGSTVSGNTAAFRGGGIYTAVGNLTLTNSTLSGNMAAASGSGTLSYGGGIFVKQHMMPITLTQVTLARNSAQQRGGGMMIVTSGAGTLTMQATLVASNTSGASAPSNVEVETGSVSIAGTHDLLFGAGMSNTSFATAPATGDPLLGSLTDNGGFTQTITLGIGSAARDAYAPNGNACDATTDQRGIVRPQNGNCDIGALEMSNDVIFANSFEP